MELKDNFTNRYFKPDLVKTQMDLVNQPTATDAYADAFSKGGQGAAKSSIDYEANALMSGIGAGLKGSADDKRQEKLDPLLKMTGQINAQSAYLEAQMQEEQQETMQVQQFVKSQSYAFSELAKASTAGDMPASNNIARGILQQYKNTSGDPIIGDFDHYHDGIIYYSNAETGEKGGLSVSQLISQSGEEGAQSLGADYPLIMSAFSTGFKGQYENTQELQRLERDKLQANINNTNAQTGLYGSKTQKNENDITNPPMSPAQTKTKELNEVKFNTRHEKAEEKRVLNNAYDQYIDNILDAKKKGLTGKSPKAEWNRYWAEKTGQSENMDIEEMLRITHANRVKELGGSNANIKQFEVAMASAPSITKDPDATIKFLDKVIEQNNEYLDETDYLGQIWENSNWQGQERSVLNNYRAQNKVKNNKADRKNTTQDTSYVIMVNQETGEEMEVPSGKVSLFKQNGYE